MKHLGECTTGSKRMPVVVIATHAVSLGVTLVTNNEADFHGLARLVVQNWVDTSDRNQRSAEEQNIGFRSEICRELGHQPLIRPSTRPWWLSVHPGGNML